MRNISDISFLSFSQEPDCSLLAGCSDRSLGEPNAHYERMVAHLLLLLVWRTESEDKEHYDGDFLLNALADHLEWFWGHKAGSGYMSSLSGEDRELADAVVEQQAMIPGTLAALFVSEKATEDGKASEVRSRLRSVLVRVLESFGSWVTPDAVAQTVAGLRRVMHDSRVSPVDVGIALGHLLQWQSEIEFREAIADKLQISAHSISLDEEHGVMKPAAGGTARRKVRCLKIWDWEGDPGLLLSVIADYMRYRDLDYYRITVASEDALNPTRVVYSTDNPDFRFISHRGESDDLGVVSAAAPRHRSLQSKIEEVALEAGIALEAGGDILVTDSSGRIGMATTG